MTEIQRVKAWEVLDSRGDPTVRVAVETPCNRGVFTIPAGASTGTHEAVEHRDGGDRYGGRGVQTAVNAVEEELADVVVGRNVTEQRTIDEALVECDGTDDLSRLGANAVLGVSGAVAHTASAVRDEFLYKILGPDDSANTLPLPMVNILSGGLHAEGGIEIQDFLVMPIEADTYSEAIEMAHAIRAAVQKIVIDGGHRPLVADEGGFAPPLDGIDDAFELLADGVREAGYIPGNQVAFAVDVAASHFFDPENQQYVLDSLNQTFTREEMIDLVVKWTRDYPLVSIEDPLAEDDWQGWSRLVDRLDDNVQVLGDDLLVTNADRVSRAIKADAATSVLVKPNQAGTITRTTEVLSTAKQTNFGTVVSARSGETSDTTIADLAVGSNAGQIKIGSLARSERLAKYNRLFEIEQWANLPLAKDPLGTN